MVNSTDRRPWVIVSKTEALALMAVVNEYVPREHRTPTLQRAMDVITRQIEWIDGKRPEIKKLDEVQLKAQTAARDLGEHWQPNGSAA